AIFPLLLLLLYSAVPIHHLHSFPTRRSSDLWTLVLLIILTLLSFFLYFAKLLIKKVVIPFLLSFQRLIHYYPFVVLFQIFSFISLTFFNNSYFNLLYHILVIVIINRSYGFNYPLLILT